MAGGRWPGQGAHSTRGGSRPGPGRETGCLAGGHSAWPEQRLAQGSRGILHAGPSCLGRGNGDLPGQSWLSDRVAYLTSRGSGSGEGLRQRGPRPAPSPMPSAASEDIARGRQGASLSRAKGPPGLQEQPHRPAGTPKVHSVCVRHPCLRSSPARPGQEPGCGPVPPVPRTPRPCLALVRPARSPDAQLSSPFKAMERCETPEGKHFPGVRGAFFLPVSLK